jgi:hypothetical protein
MKVGFHRARTLWMQAVMRLHGQRFGRLVQNLAPGGGQRGQDRAPGSFPLLTASPAAGLNYLEPYYPALDK